jgi:ATP-binding cassette, subfamily F, member 3
LLESLEKFTGTVVFVSHDRYFIDKLATRVFEIGDGRVEVFPGNYEDYLWRKQGGSAAAAGVAASPNGAKPHAVSSSAPAPVQPAPETEAKQKRINPIKLKQMKERLKEVEEEVVRLEAAIVLAETALQSFVSVEETQLQTDLLNRSKAELEQRMAEWEELAQTLETS